MAGIAFAFLSVALVCLAHVHVCHAIGNSSSHMDDEVICNASSSFMFNVSSLGEVTCASKGYALNTSDGEAGDNATCLDTGKWEVSGGVVCGDIDECNGSRENNCTAVKDGGSCTNTDGGYTCGCAAGFTGDGIGAGCKTLPSAGSALLTASPSTAMLVVAASIVMLQF